MGIRGVCWSRAALLATPLLACLCASGQNTASISGAEQELRIPARVAKTVDDANRIVLRGNLHPLARPEFDRGTVEESRPMNRMLLLLQRSAEQERALQQLMEEQQTKSSPNYHRWLTPDQFGKRFGPADSDIQAVTDWLTSQGFQVNKVSTGRTVIEFSGIAAQVQNTFHTELHKFHVKGEEHVANVSEPQIPAALAPVVKGVAALHNFRPKPMLRRLGTFQRNPKTGAVKPAFTFSDVNGTFYAMGPADFATIYNIPSTATGAGQKIAIVGQTNINLQDVRDFRSIFGLPVNDPQVILNGPDPGLVTGDETESDLDVQWAGAVAPHAQIVFVATQTTDTDFTAGVDASAMYIIDNNVAPVMSESYGSCEANLAGGGNAFYNSIWQQAASEGITVVISSGDNGSAGCDDPNSQSSASQGVAVSGFASTPYNVAVGGTDFDDAANLGTFWNSTNNASSQLSAVGYIPEIPWNDSCAATGLSGCASVSGTSSSLNVVAGSGGPSNCATSSVNGSTGAVTCIAGYAKPSWQQGGITPNDGVRDLPDVSFFASDGHNRSFYVVCESDQDIPGNTGCNLTTFSNATPFHDFQAVGGTSASAPAFAGIMALVNQQQASRQGNPNYVLYGLAKGETFSTCNSSSFTDPTKPAPAGCVFYDVTKGNISVACSAGTPDCSKAGTTGFGVMTTSTGGTTIAYGTATGYDLATGLGSVNVANLLAHWAAPSLIGTTTTLVGPAIATLDSSVTFTGTVTKSSGTATPTGLVLLEDMTTGVVIDKTTLPSSGNYSITTSFLPAATSPYNVIAHYGGDGTFASSNSSAKPMSVAQQGSKVVVSFVNFTGTSRTTPVLSTAPQSLMYGSPYILRVDVTKNDGTPCENFSTGVVSFVCPTGTIQLFNNSTPLNDFPTAQTANASNTANLNERGFAEDQPIQLSPGAYNITASYTAAANSSYTSNATSNTLSVTITKAITSVAVVPSPTTITSGGTVMLTARIGTTSNGAGPTGTVQFKNGSTALGSGVTCTPNNATGSAAAFCTASVSTMLSQLMPLPIHRPEPRIPIRLIWIVTSLLLLVFLIMLRRLPEPKRRRVAYAGLALFALTAAGIAGCSGSSSSNGTGRSVTITAIYSGDANYASSSGTGSVNIQ